MRVTNRNGRLVACKYDKITEKMKRLANMEPALDLRYVDPTVVAQKTIAGLYDGIKTAEIDELAAETAAAMTIIHPDYDKLAARILIDNLHKTTPDSFSEAMIQLFNAIDPKTGEVAPKVSEELIADMQLTTNQDEDGNRFIELDKIVNTSNDFNYTYFGLKTLMRSYLLKDQDGIVETPQYMLMRVALGIWGDDYEKVIRTYQSMSQGLYTHATPTLFNSGTPHPQLSSCFLVANEDDSIEGLFDVLGQSAKISKWAGGIGQHISNIRSAGSYIKGTGGTSDGIVPMARTYNDVARWINQGGKRKGSFAMYMEPWHADVFDFLDLKKNHGKEEMRARDLFYALWIPDLFMERVKQGGNWTLMCPYECPGLNNVYGEEFTKLYEQYEREGRGRKTIKAQDLWFKILESQIETGTPYMCYKDAANEKSNQKNLGTIKSSNLCTEIMEFSSPSETAVCNLGSLALPKFLNADGSFDFDKLHDAAYELTDNLDRVIDVNFYPTPQTRKSNQRHRPIGIGVQGLADVFMMKKIAFDSEEARQLNDDIFEAIYYAALMASSDLAAHVEPYETFQGSPASEGILQFDMWNKASDVESKGRYDWDAMREKVKSDGLRNSLLLAPMPTASTAQILGNIEAFEPITSNLYTRRVLSGEFIQLNKHLVKDLIEIGKWDKQTRKQLMIDNGSVVNLNIPQELKDVYKTAWELSMKVIINMSADRGKYICQSQSLNIFMENANFGKLSSMHFHGWQSGLKTGMYYLRTKAATDAIKFTIDKSDAEEQITCSIDDPEGCESCSG